MKAFNDLSHAQAERLALLAEECGEVVQAIGKVLRHGYERSNPNQKSRNFDNRYDLEKEIGDLLGAIGLMRRANDIDAERLNKHYEDKLANVARYMHHAKD